MPHLASLAKNEYIQSYPAAIYTVFQIELILRNLSLLYQKSALSINKHLQCWCFGFFVLRQTESDFLIYPSMFPANRFLQFSCERLALPLPVFGWPFQALAGAKVLFAFVHCCTSGKSSIIYSILSSREKSSFFFDRIKRKDEFI